MKIMAKILVLFVSFTFASNASSCEKREIKYVVYSSSDSVDEYITLKDFNVRLPIDSVSDIYHDKNGITLFTKEKGVYAITKKDLNEELVESVFHLAQKKDTDYCKFDKISEMPSINFFSGFLSADYSVFERFIILKGVTLSGVNSEYIFFSIGKNQFGSIIVLSNPNPDNFISDFIYLNRSTNKSIK